MALSNVPKGAGVRSFSLAVLMLCLAGCATIFGSRQKAFDLRSEPDGAEVFLDGARLGTTPFKLKLSNQKEHTFVFRKAGYKEVSCTLAKGTSAGWVIADILLGLVPVVIDAATENWSQTKGDACLGSLEPMPGGAVEPTVAAAPAPQPADASSAGPPLPAATADSGQGQPADRPVSGYGDAPPGTAFVGDARIRVFYPMRCAAEHQIPRDHQIYFMSEAGAVRDGFTRTGDC
jgi:hypothetical protein